MYVIYIIDDWWIYLTVKVYNISRRIFLFNMIRFFINHLQYYLNWRWFIKNSKSNMIKLKKTQYIWKYLATCIYLQLCPFRLIISLILLPMKRIVLSSTSIGIISSVVLTLVEKAAKSSQVICWSKASWRNLRLTIWKIFSIGFKSGLLAGIVNFRAPISSQADVAFTLFCEGSSSCKKSFPLGLALF